MMNKHIFDNITFGQIAGHLFFLTVVGACVSWLATAFWVQLTGAHLYVAWAALGITTCLALIYRVRAPRLGWGIVLVAGLVSTGWYQSIRPSHEKAWSFDVAHGVKARVDGDVVSLDHVRNFTWIDEASAIQDWDSETYDLSKLARVDMITSVWDTPDIAHLLVSFGFSDGKQIAFSVETRKEAHERYSALGGFFRQFELVLIAATEEDIVKLRTNHRKEDVRLYRVNLDETQRRDLFMSYVDLAQDLEEKPAFYNTLTANCTTTIYKLARIVTPNMRPNWRVVLSGHLPEYIDQMGGFSEEMRLEDRMAKAAITQKAMRHNGSDFSRAIRN